MQTGLFTHTTQPWWIRYKIYHIPFWFAYHFTWWSVAVGSPVTVLHSFFNTAYGFKNLFYVLFQALAVYFNLYYLIPKFLEKGRYTLYISLVLLTIFACALCIVPGYYLSAWVAGSSVFELYGVQPNNYFHFLQTNTLASSAASMTLAMSVKLTKNWIQAKRREQLLENEKLETELKFLKYQFNPHFLFNTINSIFVLIHKNPDMASESLAKFSELLRHQLYESNEKSIPLSKEIDYLENFIELEKLRQSSHTEIRVHLDKHLSYSYAISPFILMTFVENAFKHVSHKTGETNWIDISLRLQGQHLHFTVTNSVSAVHIKQAVQYSGIGLQNVRRRLDLIYPNLYKLNIEQNEHHFKAGLILQLEAMEHTVGAPQEIITESNFIPS